MLVFIMYVCICVLVHMCVCVHVHTGVLEYADVSAAYIHESYTPGGR